MISEAARAKLSDCLGPDGYSASDFRDNVRVIVPSDRLYQVLEALKKCGFDMLVDVTAVDYLHYPDAKDRFGLIYALVLFRILPGRPWQKGVLAGVIFWLALEVLTMPMIGGGFFSSQVGGMKVVIAALFAHLIYGITLGGIAGGPAPKQA